MKILLLVFISLACGAFCSPEHTTQTTKVSSLRDLDTITSTKLLILDLIRNLRNAAEQALDAVSTFQAGLIEQAQLFEIKLEKDLHDISGRIEKAIDSIASRFIGVSGAVAECIEGSRNHAETLVNATVVQIKECGQDRLQDVSSMLDKLSQLNYNATQFANKSVNEIKNCVQENQLNLLALGTCLAGVSLEAEREGAIFAYKFGVAIARINLCMATLPAALEVCAGSHLVQLGIGSAKILMDIGQCSISSLYSFFTTNDFDTINHNLL